MTWTFDPDRYPRAVARRAVQWASALGAACGAVVGTLAVFPVIGTLPGALVGGIVGLALGVLNAVVLSWAASQSISGPVAGAMAALVSGVPAWLACPDVGRTPSGLSWAAVLGLFCAAAGAWLGPAVLARSAAECWSYPPAPSGVRRDQRR